MQIYHPGTMIGQYEIASLPMKGGMGIVYFALDHNNDGNPIALKTFRPEYLPDRAARDRFLREGTAWVELGKHANIVRCYKVFYQDPLDYLVLELVAKEQNMPNASLRPWLIPSYPLSVEKSLLFTLQIARGIQHATKKIPGFVHRDLKPENVLVGADNLAGTSVNRLRVTDFGLIKVITEIGIASLIDNRDKLNPAQSQFTRGVGTPLYMAPEQWIGEPVGVFTDVYALGCILYEMLSGQYAVQGQTNRELEEAHCKGRIRPLPRSLPGQVVALVKKCLAIKPKDRFITWDEATKVLEVIYTAHSGKSAPPEAEIRSNSQEERIYAGWSFNEMGISYADIGKAVTAQEYFERAEEIGKQEGEQRLEGTGVNNRGIAHLLLGNVLQAIKYHEQALTIDRELGNQSGEGNVLGNLGLAYLALGEAKRAIGYYEQQLAITQKIGDLHGENLALGNLGGAYLQLGEARRAIGYSEKQLDISQKIGDQRQEGNALINIGSAFLQLGDVRRAISNYEQGLAIASKIGDRMGERNALGNLAEAHRNLGMVRPAIHYSDLALAIDREIGDRHGEEIDLGNLGLAYLTLGEAKRAIDYYEDALAIAREIGDRRGEGNALGYLGVTYKRRGEIKCAIMHYTQQLNITREIGDQQGEATSCWNLGLLYEQQGDLVRAADLMQVCVNFERKVGHPDAEKDAARIAHLGVY